MGYVLSDRLEVSIFINDVEYPLDTMNVLDFLHLGMSTRQLLPTCHFRIVDVMHVFDSLSLQDGIPIRISLKPWQATTQTYDFRKFHHKKTFNGTEFSYEVDGYLAVPKYWAGTLTSSMRGTSADIISSISATCGFTYDGDVTNDNQLWIPRNRTYGEFATKIASRGYVNDSSYMVLGTGLDGKLHYKNITTLPPSKKTLTFGQATQGTYPVINYAPRATSGLSNRMTGYQHSRYTQSLLSETTFDSFQSVTFTPDVKGPLFNTAIKNNIVTGYKTFGGIDVGNTHENYDQAIYQNIRFANTYSMTVEFELFIPSELNLLDKFTFSVDTTQQMQDVAYSGDYIVAAKAQYIQGARFVEKILGTRQGTNLNYDQG